MSDAATQRVLTARSGAIAAGFLLSVPGAIGGALVLAPLWAVIGVLAAPWRALPRLARAGGSALVLFVAFFLWVQLSMLWAPHYYARVSSHFAGGFITGLLLIAAFVWRRDLRDNLLVHRTAAWFLFGSIALGAIELFFKAPISRLFQPEARVDLLLRAPMKGVTVLVATMWAISGIMWRYGIAGCLATAAAGTLMFVLALVSNMDANVAAVLLGALGFGVALKFGHNIFRIVCLGIAGFILLAPALFAASLPLLAALDLPASWAMRVDIWHAALTSIQEHPLFGSGFGSFRDVALSFNYEGAAITAQHTHNAPLQIWFETGFVGAVLSAAALALLAWNGAAALRGDRAGAAAATGTILAVTPIAFLSFATWQEWWVATMLLAGAIAAAARAPSAPAAASETGSSEQTEG